MNWILPSLACNTCARVLIDRVLAVPGKPSSRTLPLHSSAMVSVRTTSSCPMTEWDICSIMDWMASRFSLDKALLPQLAIDWPGGSAGCDAPVGGNYSLKGV